MARPVSDLVIYRTAMVMPDGAPSSLPTSPENWLSNSAGVEEKSTYLAQIRGAGFVDVVVRSEVPY